MSDPAITWMLNEWGVGLVFLFQLGSAAFYDLLSRRRVDDIITSSY
jgi:hypothetical protein